METAATPFARRVMGLGAGAGVSIEGSAWEALALAEPVSGSPSSSMIAVLIMSAHLATRT
jgi:hypothetical protein